MFDRLMMLEQLGLVPTPALAGDNGFVRSLRNPMPASDPRNRENAGYSGPCILSTE